MNLVDLKLHKKTEKELKKTMEVDQPSYPYGFRLSFDAEQIKKLPQLEKVKFGEKVTIQAVGEVMEIRKIDRQKDNSQFSVEIQLKQIGVQGSSPKKDESLIGAIEKAKKGELK
jgi:hypothetical protein